MHHESLNVIIQRHFSKLFFIDDFYFLGGGQSLFGGVQLLG